jgi:hypothetical protein
MSRIWAVARHTIAEGIRMKVAVVFIAILLVILAAVPLSVAGDGVTLRSRIESFLSYTLTATTFLLSMLTVFMACGSLANEIRAKHIIMIVSKPIPRWQFFVGKWTGIVVLDAALLVLAGLSVWGSTAYLKSRPTIVPGDRAALMSEVLCARYGVHAEKPDFSVMVEERYRKLREEGRLEELDENARAALRLQIAQDLRTSWWSIGPGEVREFKFTGLMVDRDRKNTYVQVHLKPTTPTRVDDLPWRVLFQGGDRSQQNTMAPESSVQLIAERSEQIPVPVYAVNPDGTLYFRMANLDPQNTMTFQGDDAFELLYDIGTFHWNLFRALSVIWCRLAFLAALGLLASSFVSFPVACMLCLLILMTASGVQFLHEAVGQVSIKPDGQDPLPIIGPVLRPVANTFLWLAPDFSKFDPVGNIVGGRVVPIMWILDSILVLILIKGLVLGVLGCVILTRRELAQVVV